MTTAGNSISAEGMALLQAGNAREAELRFRQALAINPRDLHGLIGLGIVAHQSGHFGPALDLFDRAIAVDPQQAAAHVNRGNALAAQSRFADAVAAFDRALTIAPALPSALVNMATSLHALGRIDDAVGMLERARAVQPDSPELINNLGNFYKDQGRLAEALACYDRALELNPMMQQAFSNRLSALKVDSRATPEYILDEHRRWADWFEAAGTSAPLLQNPADADRRLRIGYVSPDCHTAVPAFVDPVITAHYRERFDVFCYFNNPQEASRLAALGVTGTSRVMRGMDDAQVAKQVHDDGIDILIDIAGHTGHNRLGVFARRPAPVQMTWLDYLCTTGLAAMDYRITDAIADPEGNEAFHSEKLLRMPHTQWCWQPDGSAPDVSAPPSERNGCITFGSFNNAQKLTDSTLALWRALLNALPEARMRIGGIADGFARARVLEALGCQESRLTFLPRLGTEEYRQSFADVDIALDPTPFSGATTTLDALWQGVPVLTLPGERSCSRSSASLLSALAMNAWIASDADDFVGLAKRHSADRQGLIELRKGLRGRMRASPLLDVGAFTADLENLYRRAWHDWCESRIAADGAPSLPAGEHDALMRARSAMDAGQIDAAMTVLKPLIASHPDWEIAKRDLARAALAWSRAHPEALPVWSSPVPKTSRRKVSAIVCSIRPDYFNAVRARLGEQFADHDFELIGIHDAKSLCEGYNRGAARAMGDVLIFCHDDIDTVHDDFGERVLHHLAHHDVLGVVGTSRLVGGDWGYAGAPHVHGQVVHRPPGETGFIYLGVGLQAPVITGIQALDGVFIATHRHVWEAVRFDQDTFDGFHLYDIDFTWRAHLAGYRLAVPLDLLLLHFSTGRYDMKWQAFHRRFLAKFPQLSGRPSATRYANLHVKLQTLEQVERLHSGLFHHNFGARTPLTTEFNERTNYRTGDSIGCCLERPRPDGGDR